MVSNGNLDKLNLLVETTAKGILDVKSGYIDLIDEFPVTTNCKLNLTTFLHEILLEEVVSNIIIDKCSSNKEENESTNIKYFDENNGVIILSGNERNVGEIVYANQKFSDIIGQNINTIIGSNITTFIPYLYVKNHNKNLIRFANFCLNSEVPFSGTLFLQTEQGYLIESVIKSRCSAIGSNVFYLALIKFINFNRSIILYDKNGLICSYSRKVPEILGISNLKMLLIQDLFDFNIFQLKLNSKHTIKYNNKTYGFVRSQRNVANTKMELLLIYEDINDMAK